MATTAVERDNADASTPEREATDPRPRPQSAGPTRQIGPIAVLVVGSLMFTIFSGQAAPLNLPVDPGRVLLLVALVLLVCAKRPRWRRTPLLAVMLLTVLWTAWSWASTGSLGETYQAFGLLDRIVVPFVMFLIGPAVFDTPARRDFLLKALSLVGIYLGLTGLAQYLGEFQLVYPTYARALVGGVRATGPFNNVEAQGMSCTITMVAGAVLAGRRTGLWRAVGLVALVCSILGNTYEQTRSTWIAGVAALLLLPLLVPRMRKWIVLLWGGLAGAAALVARLDPHLVAQLQQRADDQNSVVDRVLSNDGALRAIEAHPWSGIGWLQFQNLHAEYVMQSPTLPFFGTDFEVHDVFLSRAAETGILGAALWVLAIVMGPVAALLLRPRTPEMVGWRMLTGGAFLAWLVPSLVSPNAYPFPNFLFWLIAGITAAPLVLRGTTHADHASSTPVDDPEPVAFEQ